MSYYGLLCGFTVLGEVELCRTYYAYVVAHLQVVNHMGFLFLLPYEIYNYLVNNT